MHSLLITLTTALRALRRNVFRSALTCLGIVIAVAAVIAMVEIGDGSNTEIQKTIASVGAANLIVFPYAADNGGVSQGAGTGLSLTPEDCDLIARECPAVRSSAPIVRGDGQVIHGNLNWMPGRVIGSTPAYFNIHQWENFAAGTSFSNEDVQSASQVCLVGLTLAEKLFGDESPLGQDVRLNNVTLKVVGVLGHKGASVFGSDQDDIIVTPWTTMKYRVNGAGGTSGGKGNVATAAPVNKKISAFPASAPQIYPAAASTAALNTPINVRFENVDQFLIDARSQDTIPEAIEQITALLRERHHLQEEQEDNFIIRDMTEIGNMVTSTGRMMTQLLLVVATISLIVGGVGIMNIMMVSVTERTREIGLRMAVGAKGRDILQQFLIEAVVLCLIGGLVGLAFGRVSSMTVSAFMHWPTKSSPGAAIAALGVSAAVGIIFGFYPAWKASRLNPIEALRYE